MDRFVWLGCFLGAVLGCQSLSTETLQGQWKASTVVEEGDTLDLDLKHVVLTFKGDEFKYRHTQRDSLMGNYDLAKGLLNLYVKDPSLDTIIIELNDIHPSAIVLRMNHDGKERLVTMTKDP
ncbi:MAG: lipocalin family protein [Saprospiraceae bacterium]|nr:lipocalin family protein [Saprospiraceae bacterium]